MRQRHALGSCAAFRASLLTFLFDLHPGVGARLVRADRAGGLDPLLGSIRRAYRLIRQVAVDQIERSLDRLPGGTSQVKLVTTDPIGIEPGCFHRVRDRDQHGVAGVVPEIVIDPFQGIGIDRGDKVVARDLLVECCPVADPGHGIRIECVDQLLEAHALEAGAALLLDSVGGRAGLWWCLFWWDSSREHLVVDIDLVAGLAK